MVVEGRFETSTLALARGRLLALGVEGFEGMVAGEVDERVIWPVTCSLAAFTQKTVLQ